MTNCVTIPSKDAFTLATETLAAIHLYRQQALELAIEEAKDCNVTKTNYLRWFLFKSPYYVKNFKNDTDAAAKRFLQNKLHPSYFGSNSVYYHIKSKYDSCEWLCKHIIHSIPDKSDSATVSLGIYDSERLCDLNRELCDQEKVKKKLEAIKGQVDSIYKF